ncbi:PRKR-interacting protein 1 homolog [Daphnia carinata]|uniref:PRKR-interacting protein 1 homolog n=1 Tax=Daphnia carinata TaxID=120202 RepID=UPI00257BC10E|nr:PRKR-interacting protein 1 homolog [Daphnia carinata]
MAESTEKKKKVREPKEVVVVKNTYDYQRMKLDRLMRNPEKPVQLPERPKEKKAVSDPPDFVRNVMGSSAGAGSGEFHVYRHIRRREYARQKNIQIMSEKDKKDEDFRQKLENNQRQAEERTAKKRAKRLKKKQLMKATGKKHKTDASRSSQQETSSSSDTPDTADEPEDHPKNKPEDDPENKSEDNCTPDTTGFE